MNTEAGTTQNVTPTALKGVRVGHAGDPGALTGVTVVVFDRDLPVATRCYGGSPGTFNTDALDGGRNGARAHAIFVSGGSYTGLQSGAEIMKGLIDQEIGYQTHDIINPCVTGAIVMDLGVRVGRFDPALASAALRNAHAGPVERGNVGAGTGTAVGKFHYPERGRVFAGMKACVGCARVDLVNGAFVVAPLRGSNARQSQHKLPNNVSGWRGNSICVSGSSVRESIGNPHHNPQRSRHRLKIPLTLRTTTEIPADTVPIRPTKKRATTHKPSVSVAVTISTTRPTTSGT